MKWETLSRSEGMQVIKFLPLLRKAVAAAPDRLVFKVQLARALFEAGQTAELVDLLEPLVSDEDAAAELLYWLGRAAIAKGDDPLALVALRSAAAKGAEDAFDLLAATLARLGREDEALNAGLEALKRNPRNPESLRSVAIALCNRCETERLWNLCLDLRSRGAHGGWFSAVMASTAAMLGREDELGKLMDRSKWFLATPLAVPEGFNRGLAAEILADQSAHPMPKTMVTHGAGARVDHLQRSESPHTQDLFRLIRAAVENYVAEREIHSSDPIIAHRPSAVALKSWSLAVHDDGHTSWHFHPSGWLSGVYYVEMPIIEPSGVGHQGAIEFGPYPFGRDTDQLKAHRWHLMPTPGLFLLFPSYYAHRTWPTGVVASRISVAFDVRPAPSGVDAEQSG
jgi:tetratricopeptide (TPR) repeat protein